MPDLNQNHVLLIPNKTQKKVEKQTQTKIFYF